MNRVWNVLLVGALVVPLAMMACSDDVASGGDCPAGQSYNPIDGECTTCSQGEDVNPLSGECEPVDDDNGTESNGGSDNGGQDTNDSTNQSDNDGPGYQGDGVEPPHDPYDPDAPGSTEYHSCDSDDFSGLDSPQFIHHASANYLVAANSGIEVSTVDTDTVPVEGHVLEDGDDGYAGFVVSVSPPSGQTTAVGASDWVFDSIGDVSGYNPTRQGDGQSYLTHDNFQASILNHISIDTDDVPGDVRDKVVARLHGQAGDDLDHSLSETADGDGSGIHLVYKTVVRGDDQVIVIGGITTTDRHETPDSEARFAVQDLAGGSSVAGAGETMSEECVSLELKDTDEVDIIISLDASGSMTDVQSNLQNFTDELTQVLDNAGVDWRVGVTGVDCNEIWDDDDVSPEFRALWPDPDEWEGEDLPFIDFDMGAPCEEPSSGFIGGDDNNGRLMEGTFTTDPDEIEDRLGMVSGTGLEYTLTMGLAALDHTLPRADDDPEQLRTHAAPVVIVVTDENEQLFKDEFGNWISGGNDPLSTSQQAELHNYIDPWLGFVNRPDLNATISGLYWVPSTSCAGGEDVAHGIHHVVEQTGGTYDSICAPDVTDAFSDIADATQDLETGLHLIGNPWSGSVEVDIESDGGSVEALARSIADGFDFDSTNNSLYFEGPSAPQEGDRVVVPYLQWDRNAVPCSASNPCPDGMECAKGTCQ